ncbi:hypothetical protein COT99_04330 [Candidatus Falkowbacteria bacterium CG10_big_fil_rev_8_21_14_0_10_43_10]|uniref:Uncharacterized protein n=1 Tax=Candidatus Falkowbacteria bacterium CG10_big_fil_rev_8_21_14_0_10_43_10 TaxID=1974567 RepID=A0A2H0V154_9BACT|nr:MAG: hypothetical protein COT99_04330 [Candidatus Falkowbacteria bacterium CG10_big_fil_rev_8_21_14_0_10_43_10]
MAEEIKKIFNSQFHQQVEGDLNNIILRDDAKRAFELADLIEKILSKHRVEFQEDEAEREFYHRIMIKAKFIALPLLDNADALDLLKNYFLWQFRIPDYDVISKINSKLAAIIIMEERDLYKEELRKALMNNGEMISNTASIRKIRDWIKDYTAQVGPGPADNVERRQYFTDLTKNKEIDETHRRQLELLLTLYELLKYPSSTPLGHEEAYIFDIGGQRQIFNRGQLVDLKIADKEEYERVAGILNSMKEETGMEDTLKELKDLAGQYPAGSLERRAVEEEIRKIKN